MFYKAKHKQRFSIRKYSFGVASVLLGTFILGVSAPEASADENSTVATTNQVQAGAVSEDASSAETEVAASNSNEAATEVEAEPVNEEVADTNAAVEKENDEAAVTGSADVSEVEADKTSEVNKEDVAPVATPKTAFRAARVARAATEATPGDPNTPVSAGLQEELEKNAVYSPGVQGAKKSYAGKAWLQTTGTAMNGFGSGDVPMAGVKVYLQWVNGKGHVSKIYYTTTEADGTFVINLDHPELENGNNFQLAGDGKFAIRTWINNPDPAKYNVVKQGDGIYGFHTRTNRNNESWDFTAGVNRIVNGQVILQDKVGEDTWLMKPEDQWEKSPNASGEWADQGAYGALRGYAWFENGDYAGSLANQWINDGNDVKATGTKIVASYLNDEVTRQLDAWKKEHKGYQVEDMRQAQAEIIKAYQEANGVGSHIAETVVGTVDANGWYYIPFRGLYGISATKQNSGASISHTITDEEYGKLVSDADVNHTNLMAWNGTIGQKHRHINQDYMYVTPLIDNYNVWSNAFPSNIFQNPADKFLTMVDPAYNIKSINFAIMAPQPMIDALNYDASGDHNAFAGDKVEATIGGLLPSREYQVQWFRDGVAVGDPVTIVSTVDGTFAPADSTSYTIPNDLTGPTNFTVAVFEQGTNTKSLDNALALDSLLATTPVADSYVPVYTPVEGAIGEDAQVAAPKFMDKEPNGTEVTAPEGTKFATATTDEEKEKAKLPADAVVLDPTKVTVDEATGAVTVKGDALPAKGTYVTPVVVTYPDGSKDYTYATVNVAKDYAETYDATGGTVNKELGQPTTEDDLKGAVTYTKDGQEATAPEGTTVKPKDGVTLPDGTTAGTFEVPSVVTYPDGSTDDVVVKVVVTDNRTDADKNEPKGQDVNTGLNETPKAEDGISNKGDLPEGTTYEWKTPVDTTTPGEKDAVVVVKYPDGSSEEVPVKVVVTDGRTDADKNEPKGQDVNTGLNETPKAEDGISNKGDLPEGTTYEWKTPVDTTTPGEKDAVVVVKYPDGSSEEVPVKVVVTSDADKYEPKGQDVNTGLNETPKAEDAISNKGDLPEDTKYEWKTPIDTSTPGEKEGVVVITYPDGSSEEVRVKVVVADKRTDTVDVVPTGKDKGGSPESTKLDVKAVAENKVASDNTAHALPATGENDSAALAGLGAALLGGLGLAATRRKKEEI